MKILIIRFSSFGDILLSFPLLNEIKRTYPDSEIHFLTNQKYSELLQINNNIDLIVSYNGEKIGRLHKTIKSRRYDLIIDLQKNTRSIFSTFFTGVKKLRIKKQNFKKYFLVKFKINLFSRIIPVYLKYFNCCFKYLKLTKNVFTTSNLNFFTDRLIKEKYFVIAPASRHFTKSFPEYKFEEIIKNFSDYKIVLISDNTKEETGICKRLAKISNNCINYGGKIKYEALANVLHYSDFVICNDSAIMHFAEALGKKVFAIFGSSVKEFGFYPQLKSSVFFENENLKCRPCSHIGRDSCPLKHFNCMEDIDVRQIISQVKSYLNN